MQYSMAKCCMYVHLVESNATYTQTHTYTLSHTHSLIHMLTRTYTNIHIHMHMHTHTHTHTLSLSLSLLSLSRNSPSAASESAPSHRHSQPSNNYHAHENAKKWMYEQRIREIEHSSFTPLVMLLTGGLGREAQAAYKHLASVLAAKRDSPYSSFLMSTIGPNTSFTVCRYTCNQCNQHHIRRIRRRLRCQLAMTCKFSNFLDKALQDRLICGLHSESPTCRR